MALAYMAAYAPRMIQESLAVFPDQRQPNDWRVEYQDEDGGCYVVIFAGPEAERRARAYFAALKSGALNL